MARWVLHVDLDQFIAAVEVLRRPELRGRPVVVGGDGDPTKRGVVSTASYEAREYGVHSGLPMRTALRRCPDAVFLPVDREVYEAVSSEVMTTLREVGDVRHALVEVIGWDEAFLDVDTEDPEAVAHEIRRRVRDTTALDCTVGIGENKLQAKLATGFGKPDGIFRLTLDTWFDAVGSRSPDVLYGVGAKTARRLGRMGIATVAELAAADPDELAERFGPTTGPWLVRTASGRHDSPVVAVHEARSRSREVTYQENIGSWDEVRREVSQLSHRVAGDTRREGRLATRVVVKVRYAPFVTRTHGYALTSATAEDEAIERAALAALDRFTERRPVRMLGVRAEFAT